MLINKNKSKELIEQPWMHIQTHEEMAMKISKETKKI